MIWRTGALAIKALLLCIGSVVYYLGALLIAWLSTVLIPTIDVVLHLWATWLALGIALLLMAGIWLSLPFGQWVRRPPAGTPAPAALPEQACAPTAATSGTVALSPLRSLTNWRHRLPFVLTVEVCGKKIT